MVTKKAVPQSSLLSAQWYRVSSLKPVLSKHVRIAHHQGRDGSWYMLSLHEQAGQLRLNQAAWEIIARCDGDHSLNEIWQWVARNSPDQIASQHELLPILARLVRQDFVACDSWPDVEQRQQQWNEDLRQEQRQKHKLLSMRWHLGDPSALIEYVYARTAFLFNKQAARLALLLLATASICAVQQFDELVSAVRTASVNPLFWLTLWCVYPVIKGIHELAHGLCLRHFGADTPGAGIALLMLIPAPYVDASQASLLPSNRQRAAVSAAGIGAEIMLAAAALIVWSVLADGTLRQVMLATVMIGTIMTVLLNSNPLIRFDGYYVLTDLLNLPELAQRSSQRWQRWWIMQLTGAVLPTYESGHTERPWEIAYAPLAWLYRVLILSGFALWAGSYFRPAGLALILVMLMQAFILPVSRLFRSALKASDSSARTGKLLFRSSALSAALLMLCLMPVPDRSVVQAIVWTPDNARIRTSQAGYIQAVNILEWSGRNPANTAAGQATAKPIIQMADPLLDARINVQQGVVQAAKDAWVSGLANQNSLAAGNQDRFHQAERELSYLLAKREQLAIRPAYDTAHEQIRLLAPAADLPGRFIPAGELLGIINTRGPIQLRAILKEGEAARLLAQLNNGGHTRTALLRPAGTTLASFPAQISAFAPRALSELPAEAFASPAGGTIDLAADADQPLRPARPVFQLDLTLAANAAMPQLPGQKVWVRLDFGHTSIWRQAMRVIGQTLDSGMAPGLS